MLTNVNEIKHYKYIFVITFILLFLSLKKITFFQSLVSTLIVIYCERKNSKPTVNNFN